MNLSIGKNCLNKKNPFECIVPSTHKWGQNNKKRFLTLFNRKVVNANLMNTIVRCHILSARVNFRIMTVKLKDKI